jgi:hypothetical protein
MLGGKEDFNIVFEKAYAISFEQRRKERRVYKTIRREFSYRSFSAALVMIHPNG